MARRTKPSSRQSGLFQAREARGMSRGELVKRSGVSKQQLSRLENGQIRLRLDHLKPFAGPLGYTPEQILLWGRLSEVAPPDDGAVAGGRQTAAFKKSLGNLRVREIDTRASGAKSGTLLFKSDFWLFPESFVGQELHTSSENLLVLEVGGDSMAPTILSGERVVIDRKHKNPSPDGLYAVRDPLGSVVVRRLQVSRASNPPRVNIISDNHNHAKEEVSLSKLEVEGKVVCCLKRV
jgi:transcriptional regulator with XRE-family HTH domain